MNESQVRKIVRQEIKKYGERQNQNMNKRVTKLIKYSFDDLEDQLKNF